MNNRRFEPLEDRCVIRPIKPTEEEKTESGVIIPETVKKDVREGVVVSVGLGKYAQETGVFMPTVLGRGDIVLYGASQGLTITIDTETGKEDVLVMRESDVLILIKTKQIT